MDNYNDLPEQNLTALIQLSNDHPDKLKLINFIASLASYELNQLPLQNLPTRLIHLTAKYQQESLFWLILSICEKSSHFNITEQKNYLGDCVIHTLLRYPNTPTLLEGLLAQNSTLLRQCNHFQENPLHVFLNTLGFNKHLREKILENKQRVLFDFLEILSRSYLEDNKAQSNLSTYNKQGYTPLHLCALYNLDEELDFFLTHFPDMVDYPTQKNKTCLLIAAQQGHVNIIDILTKHGANLLAKTHTKQNTALHIAAQKGHRYICEKLLQAGSPLVKNNQNLSPLDLAKQNHHHDSFRVLLNHENGQALLDYSESFTPLYTEIQAEIISKKLLAFDPKELTLNTFLMGITLGYELAYQAIPEGKLIAIKNELNQTNLYSTHLLYNTSGLISHVFTPYRANENNITETYVTFQGTNDTDALHRDIEHKGPGYQSYKQKETDLIAKFFKIISPLLTTHPNKISITVAGHSLGGGDSFYFLQSILKVMAKYYSAPSIDPLYLETLITDKSLDALDEITGITNQTEKLLLQKPLIAQDLNILKINRLRIIALNPVGLPKSTDYGLEGLARYIGIHGPQSPEDKLKIESFVLRSDGDFAQRMGDRVPLCDIPAQYATVNLLLAPGDSMALQKASALYLGAIGLNPSNAPTNMLNIGTDIAALSALGGMTLGPLGILLGLATGGCRLYASDILKEWGQHMARKPHTTLLPFPLEEFNSTELLDKIKLLSNIHFEHVALIREIGQNLNTTAFEKFITEISKRQLAEKLKTSYFPHSS